LGAATFSTTGVGAASAVLVVFVFGAIILYLGDYFLSRFRPLNIYLASHM
jgi:hypothetical protein